MFFIIVLSCNANATYVIFFFVKLSAVHQTIIRRHVIRLPCLVRKVHYSEYLFIIF